MSSSRPKKRRSVECLPPVFFFSLLRLDPVGVIISIYILGYIVSYLLSRPGFTFNPTGTISIPLIIPTGFVALSASERAETELRLIRHM